MRAGVYPGVSVACGWEVGCQVLRESGRVSL